MSVSRLLSNLVKARSRKPYQLMSGGIHKDIQLPHTDEVELYHNAASSAAQKVRLCLAQKQIPYKSHLIDLSPDHSKPNSIHNNSSEYSFINPGRLVPTLVHNGNPVYESHDIIKYIHSNINGNNYNLIPPNCDEYIINKWMECAAMYGDILDVENCKLRAGNCLPGITLHGIVKRAQNAKYAEIIEQSILGKRHMLPMIAKVFGSKLVNSKKFKDIQQNAKFYMGNHLNEMNNLLLENGTKYIAGNELSMVDLPWIVVIERCRILDFFNDNFIVNEKELIGLKKYWEVIEQENCYKVAILEQEGYAEIVEKLVEQLKEY
eukprot:233556_1